MPCACLSTPPSWLYLFLRHRAAINIFIPALISSVLGVILSRPNSIAWRERYGETIWSDSHWPELHRTYIIDCVVLFACVKLVFFSFFNVNLILFLDVETWFCFCVNNILFLSQFGSVSVSTRLCFHIQLDYVSIYNVVLLPYINVVLFMFQCDSVSRCQRGSVSLCHASAVCLSQPDVVFLCHIYIYIFQPASAFDWHPGSVSSVNWFCFPVSNWFGFRESTWFCFSVPT